MVGQQLGEQRVARDLRGAGRAPGVQGPDQIGFEPLGVTRSCTRREASVKAATADASLCVPTAMGVFSRGHACAPCWVIQTVTAARSNWRRRPTRILGQPWVTSLATLRSLERRCAARSAGFSIRAQQFPGRPERHAGARHPDHRSQGIAQVFLAPVVATRYPALSRLAAVLASFANARSSFALLPMRIGRCATSDSLA